MSNKNEQALRQQRQQAVKIAEIKATDAEDMTACILDLQTYANLDEDSAKVVASAFRYKTLPNIAREAGLSEDVVGNLTNGANLMTNDFANEKKTKKYST